MKKRLPEILCMAAVLVGLLALAAQARAEQTHRRTCTATRTGPFGRRRR